MASGATVRADVVIFGGGAAGLWLLDVLHRAGHAVLLVEAKALGAGQTIASQGIIHGGLKYTLGGLLTGSAEAISTMPAVWRSCLGGEKSPNLTGTRVRAEYCHLWRTDSMSSRMAMVGARVGLKVRPRKVEDEERPEALKRAAGTVWQVDEQVIDPRSFVLDLGTRQRERIVRIERMEVIAGAYEEAVVAEIGCGRNAARLECRSAVLTAGRGNGELRTRMGLPNHRMQVRPLHMVMVRGKELPELNGHCVDGRRTRVTITSDEDSKGRRIWQVGGQIAEDGVEMTEWELIRHAKREITGVLGGKGLGAVEWATYRVERAEAATGKGVRPEDAAVLVEGRVITAWPTKLALAPRMAEQVAGVLKGGSNDAKALEAAVAGWDRPEAAKAPWEEERTWFADH